MTRLRPAALLSLTMALANTVPAAAADEESLDVRIGVLRLANQAQRIQAAQGMYRRRYGAPASTIAELLADGALTSAPDGSPIVRRGPDGPATWRFAGPDVEILLAASSLDGPECRATARMGGAVSQFGCAMRSDGVVFRYAY